MTPGRVSLMTLVLMGCTCTKAPRSADRETSGVALKAEGARRAEIDCGAGSLPRITEADVTGGAEAFIASAARGTVAVAWDGTRAHSIPECHLDGRYAEARGEGSGRFWGTNRVLLRSDEIEGPCRSATHLVAAYVTVGAARTGSARTPVQLSAILVPLPCPPTSDGEPAPGCIGRGMSGAQRYERSDALMAALDPDAARTTDVARVLEIYALIPDDHWGVRYAGSLFHGDCPLAHQGEWITQQYESLADRDRHVPLKLRDPASRPGPPQLSTPGSRFDCVATPAFLRCFPDHFVPVLTATGSWQPAAERP